MHFQDQRGLARDRAGEITEGSLVGCSNFTQSRATRLEDFRNPEPAADLNQLAARNHNLILRRRISVKRTPAHAISNTRLFLAEMSKNQNKRTRVIIHNRSSFRSAQQCEIVFRVRGAPAAPSLGESVLKIVVLRSDPGHRFHDSMPQWRATEIRVNENAGAIDHRLDAGCAQDSQRGTHERENVIEARYRSVFAQCGQFPSNGCYDG